MDKAYEPGDSSPSRRSPTTFERVTSSSHKRHKELPGNHFSSFPKLYLTFLILVIDIIPHPYRHVFLQSTQESAKVYKSRHATSPIVTVVQEKSRSERPGPPTIGSSPDLGFVFKMIVYFFPKVNHHQTTVWEIFSEHHGINTSEINDFKPDKL